VAVVLQFSQKFLLSLHGLGRDFSPVLAKDLVGRLLLLCGLLGLFFFYYFRILRPEQYKIHPLLPSFIQFCRHQCGHRLRQKSFLHLQIVVVADQDCRIHIDAKEAEEKNKKHKANCCTRWVCIVHFLVLEVTQ
jgi:hypothetical protein